MRAALIAGAAAALLAICANAAPPAHAPTRGLEPRNLIIFVADGLRPGSVTPEDAPAMAALRAEGVSFSNSHSLYPTFTTPNASAIATGHYLGDTGDFGNGLYIGYRLFDTGNFGQAPAGSIVFIENDAVLGDLDAHFGGNYLGEDSLLELARRHGYSTAAVGKLGPAAIQDVGQLAPQGGRFAIPQTILLDDETGSEAPPVAPEVGAALERAGLPAAAPRRAPSPAPATAEGMPRMTVQQYLIAATTQAVLPLLRQRGRPFVLLFWSREPDGTQHGTADSLDVLEPGINGPSSRAAVREADDNLRRILEFVRSDPALARTTDVFVTSDHGFATISKHDIDADGRGSASPAAQGHYDDVPAGFLPPGFLAMDLALQLHEPLYDAAELQTGADGRAQYAPVHGHPSTGSALIGGSGRAQEPSDAEAIVVANGGSDLIYLPRADPVVARRLAAIIGSFDYTGALFADDALGPLPGALPLASIALEGSGRLPRPSLVVAFRTFLRADSLQSAVLIADTSRRQGQGMHGSLGRDNTFNFMAASGPDFRSGFIDTLPASNADIEPTLLHILGLPARAHGRLQGRPLLEALRSARTVRSVALRCVAVSPPGPDGRRTRLEYQQWQGRRYFDRAEFRLVDPHEPRGCRR